MKYIVLSVHETDCDVARERLRERVEYLLSTGWVLVGGVSLSVSPHSEFDYKEYNLAQAMSTEEAGL